VGAIASTPIGGRLRTAREAAGYSLRDLAAASGLTQQAVGDLEAGRVDDSRISTIRKLAAALRCSAAWLAFGPG
jgi:transcriptional regulator with XRE-family HTH domain